MKYRNLVPFGLRIPPDLKERLQAAATGKPKWSLNAEILQRVEESFNQRHELSEFTDGELIDELIKRWGRDRVSIKLGDD